MDHAVDADAGVALRLQVGEQVDVLAFALADDRGEHLEASTGFHFQDPVDDLLRSLLRDRLAGFRAADRRDDLLDDLLVLRPEPRPALLDRIDQLRRRLLVPQLREAREVFERDYLIAQISRFSGNISRTAEFVGMERSALHRKLKALGVG